MMLCGKRFQFRDEHSPCYGLISRLHPIGCLFSSEMTATFKNIIYFFSATFLAKCIGISTSFFLARNLLPESYGIWVTITLVCSYSSIASLGTVEALLKQYPFLMGKGETSQAKIVEGGVFGSMNISAAITIIAGVIILALLPSETENDLHRFLFFVVLTAAVSFYSAYFYHRFAAHNKFTTVSIIETIRAISLFILLTSFSLFWGLKGAIIAFFLSELMICLISATLSIKLCGNVSPRYDAGLLYQLVLVGLPITLLWWTYTLQMSTDRIISISFLGKAATGYYGLGVSLTSALILIPQAIGRVLYPKITEGTGRTQNANSNDVLQRFVFIPTRLLTLILPVLISSLIIIAPFMFSSLFPKYKPGLVSAQVLLFGSFFVCILRNGANFLVAIDKQNKLLMYSIITILLNIAGNVFFLNQGFGINGLAYSNGLAGFVLTSLVWKSVFEQAGYNKRNQLKTLGELYYPLAVLGLVFAALYIILPNFAKSFSSICLVHALLVILFYLIAIGIIPANRKLFRDLTVNGLFKLSHLGS
jgi:O-antigen/teichoic acid export membrane protein